MTTASPTHAAGPAPEPDAARAAIVCTGIRKTYHLGRVPVPVLHGIDLSVGRGEVLAILGSSGSGKSTLLHLLGGLDRPDGPSAGGGRENARASIDVLGTRITEAGTAELDRFRARTVGFVFQFYHLLPELSVLQNVLVAGMIRHGAGIGRAGVPERARGLLEAFGLGHRLRHRPVELSGGERQRVAIARALINDPPILLADEPTGNLDRKTGETILDALMEHRASTGRTMVIVTHDRLVAQRADRVVEIVDGRLATPGTV
ncbi:MAG: ABC transporter ATP-binding protein [Phycisphaerales bacterium]|jgi:lipoprotein-releasing system ATP-binding protein|nr:ABC transporter ATP-binding protein [Phycisphaeraceae bacterium]